MILRDLYKQSAAADLEALREADQQTGKLTDQPVATLRKLADELLLIAAVLGADDPDAWAEDIGMLVEIAAEWRQVADTAEIRLRACA